jgi:hypothetical protein
MFHARVLRAMLLLTSYIFIFRFPRILVHASSFESRPLLHPTSLSQLLLRAAAIYLLLVNNWDDPQVCIIIYLLNYSSYFGGSKLEINQYLHLLPPRIFIKVILSKFCTSSSIVKVSSAQCVNSTFLRSLFSQMTPLTPPSTRGRFQQGQEYC